MKVSFGIAFAFNPESSPEVNARVLRVLLESLILINRVYLQSTRAVGNAVPSLYRSGVVYGRTRTWESIPDVRARGFGDCKSLAAWLCAEMREAGIECKPVFRWVKNPRTGTRDFHILVSTADGFKDPSKVLGMNAHNQFLPPNAP